MTFTGRTITSQDASPGGPGEGAARVVRIVARVVLWGVLLLLLFRGLVSVLRTEPRHDSVRTQTVTVTQRPAAGTAGVREGG